MKLKIIKIFFPLNFNFLLIKKNNKIILIIFNKNINFTIPLKNEKKIKINGKLNVLEYKKIYLKKNFFFIKNNFYEFLKKLNNYYFIKIKFKGKGYKIEFFRKKKTINFLFGNSHKSIILYKNLKIKKIKKYKLILYKNNLHNLKKTINKIINIRKINDFTNRGLRKSRQIIIKRKGKKGSFV